MPLELQLLDRFDDLDRIEAVWQKLSAESECSFFLSWGWVQNWLETLPREVPVKLAVLSGDEGPRCAFFLGRANVARQHVFRSKAYLVNQTGNWDYDRLYIEHNSVLQSRGDACSLQQIVDSLPGEWEELYLSAVAAGSRLANDLKISRPYEVMIANEMPAPWVDLKMAREQKGGYLSLLRSSVRSQVKRACKGYEARGPLVCEVAATLSQALDIYTELMALHEAWWRQRKKPGAFHSPWFREFHRRLIEKRFCAGEIQLVRVRCGGATVGCLYNFVWRGVVYFYQSGLASEEDNRMKPGYVCHVEAIQYCVRAGFDKYDFLAGFEDYKERLSTHQTSLLWARVQKPRIKFRVERALRDAALKGAAWYREHKRGKARVIGKAA